MKKEYRIPENLLEQLKENNIFPSDLVFYINSVCNLRCKHCYIGNELLNQNYFFNLKDSITFINSFDFLDRITILGGEPLLYPNVENLVNLINIDKIKEFRITTNLTNISPVKDFTNIVKRKLVLCVSIDGHSPDLHDFIRGKGTFNKTLNNLKQVLENGFDVEVTHTLNSQNINFFDDFVQLCKNIGIKRINIHRMSLTGNAENISNLQVSPTEYVHFCKKLKKKTGNNISIRIPVLFANEEYYISLLKSGLYLPHANKSYYGSKQRIVIYSNRQVYISSELFGTESYIGTFDDHFFIYNDSVKNEASFFKDKTVTISNLNSNFKGDKNYPYILSVSYKETITI